jgi:hypothetical protein
MESVLRVQVEWIDELVFREGFEAALNLHLSGALSGAATCSLAQFSGGLEPRNDEGSGSVVQSGAAGCMVPRAGFEPALPA